jgi:DNA mismatch repair protein MutS
VEVESAIFRRVCRQLADEATRVREVARALAEVDVFVAFAEAAARYDYIRPEIDVGDGLVIRDGRHPVVERRLPAGAFVPNDTSLHPADRQIAIITGPNMAGKSTYLRQVALITLMAHVGCFVPAASAHVGLVDRIFTRVGAQDDLAAGRSTFMVEMIETATILHQATRRSLVVLDEIGRGTSTYDGMAIARAVVEYLHNRPEAGAKTLFATHYHELVALAKALPRVHNENIAVSEDGGAISFLYRIIPGGADRSYGIHVARLAGLPKAVIARSEEILAALEEEGRARTNGKRSTRRGAPQLSLFAPPDALVSDLAELDVDAMTPLEALTRLYELRERARGRSSGGEA